jgi:hypothetical protein
MRLSLMALLFALSAAGADLRGRVVDALTREPLARVAVDLGGQRAESGPDGRFALAGAAGAVMFSTVGYRPLKVDWNGETELEVELFPQALRRNDTVEITAGAFGREAPLAVSLEGNELKNLASVLADDPLRAAHALPGTASNDDFSSQFSVRGASFERVGLYLDGLLLHQPFHMIQAEATTGSMTLLNGDLLEGLNLHASAPPPRFADRTAGALDARTREGERDRLALRLTASASNAGALLEGPLGKRKRGAWLIAARKSYLQYLIERTRESQPALAFGFTDGQGKVSYDLTPNHTLTLAAILGDSSLNRDDFAPRAGANSLVWSAYRSALLNAGWRATLGPNAVWTARAAWLRERYTNYNAQRSPLAGSGYAEWIGGGDLSAGLRRTGLLEAGFSVRRLRDDGFVYRYTFTPATTRPLDRFRGAAVRRGVYLQASRSWAEGRITVTTGGRADSHSVSGPMALSPYASAAWQAQEGTRLSAAWSHNVQYPEIQPLFSTYGRRSLLPQRAIHLLAGLDQSLNDRTRLRFEFWRRDERDLLFRPWYEPRLVNGRITGQQAAAPWENSVRAHSQGWQIFLQRRSANLFSGWAAYGYGRAEARDGVLRRSFALDDDQRHSVQLFGTWRLRATVHLSARCLYGSGQPVPGFYRGTELTNLFLAEERNRVTLPSYRRADFRVNKSWQKKRARLTLFAEVINVFNRRNLRPDELSGFDTRTGKIRLTYTRMFPIIPSAGLLVEF